jgi:hypothetical protein
MTQHILMIWMATAVGAFSGLVGCTTEGAARRELIKVDEGQSVNAGQVLLIRMALAVRDAVRTHLGGVAR